MLSAEAQPGDVVLLHPWWTERARIYVPEGLPVVGHQFSDGDDLPAAPARVGARSTAAAPRRRGRLRAGASRRPAPSWAASAASATCRCACITNGRHRPLVFSAKALLPSLQVYLEGPDGTRQACPWTGTAHRCPNGKVVSAEWHEVHFEPRPCLRFDAPGGPTKLVVELPPVPAADEVVLHTGYTWERGAFVQGVTASEVGLEVNGRTTTVTLPPGAETRYTTQQLAVPEGARVRAWLQSANPNARELCLEVYGYGRAP